MSNLCFFIPYWLQTLGLFYISLGSSFTPLQTQSLELTFKNDPFISVGSDVIMLGQASGKVISLEELANNQVKVNIEIKPEFVPLLNKSTVAIVVSSFNLDKHTSFDRSIELFQLQEKAPALPPNSQIAGYNSYNDLWNRL